MELTFSKTGMRRSAMSSQLSPGNRWRLVAQKGDRMAEASIIGIARVPVGKAYPGALNNAEGRTVAGHDIWRFS
jgi:hypothetical protein